MNVLITNLKLEGWTGTKLFVRDVARGLLAMGHRPVIYSPHPGRLRETALAAVRFTFA